MKINFLKFYLVLILIVNLIIGLTIFSFPTVAYARGGCFLGKTTVLTPQGKQPIEKLHQGDSIWTQNLETSQLEVGKIGNIHVIKSLDYYIINHQLQVTGSHPIYVQNNSIKKLVKVEKLKLGDRLIVANQNTVEVNSIDHIKTPVTVYNLIAVSPNHNFYAEGFLVHNKGGSGGSGGGFGGSGYGPGGTGTTLITSKNYQGFLKAFLFLIISVSSITFGENLYNCIRFGHQDFTEDSELIEFTKQVNKNFENRYSSYYRKDDQLWQITPLEAEIEESQYQHIIKTSELLEKTKALFYQYQNDWTHKNFENMVDYLSESFYRKQKGLFKDNFGDHFDIVYKPKILEIAPIEFQEIDNNASFLIQINASMVNFEISPYGYVMSGDPNIKDFSEYWQVGIDQDKNSYLIGIFQV